MVLWRAWRLFLRGSRESKHLNLKSCQSSMWFASVLCRVCVWSEVKKTIPRVQTRHIYKPLTQETVGNTVLCSASQSLCRSRGTASSWGIQKWMSRDSQIFWLSHSRTGWHWWHLRQIQLHRDVLFRTAPGHNQDFQGDDYELVGHNCCSFARAMVEKLGVRSMPRWVDRLARQHSNPTNFTLTGPGSSFSEKFLAFLAFQ